MNRRAPSVDVHLTAQGVVHRGVLGAVIRDEPADRFSIHRRWIRHRIRGQREEEHRDVIGAPWYVEAPDAGGAHRSHHLPRARRPRRRDRRRILQHEHHEPGAIIRQVQFSVRHGPDADARMRFEVEPSRRVLHRVDVERAASFGELALDRVVLRDEVHRRRAHVVVQLRSRCRVGSFWSRGESVSPIARG